MIRIMVSAADEPGRARITLFDQNGAILAQRDELPVPPDGSLIVDFRELVALPTLNAFAQDGRHGS